METTPTPSTRSLGGNLPPTPDALVESQVQQLLVEAGLESAPFDPASWEALKRHVQTTTAGNNSTTATAGGPTSAAATTLEDDEVATVDIYGPTQGDNEQPPNGAAAAAAPTLTTTTPAECDQKPAATAVLISNLPAAMNADASTPNNYPHRQASDLTDPGSMSFASPATPVDGTTPNNNNNSAANRPTLLRHGSSSNVSTEARVLEQLQVQTALILQLQRRVDELSDMVHRQQEQQQPPPPMTMNRNLNHHVPPEHPIPSPEDQHQILQQQQQQQQMHQEANALAEALRDARAGERDWQRNHNAVNEAAAVSPLWTFLLDPLQNVRASRWGQLYAVFCAARQQQVQAIPWGAVVKVIFMLTLLLGRVLGGSSSSSRRKLNQQDDASSSSFLAIPLKLYCLVLVVILGFLGQTGYLTFFYKFWFVERYPYRILVEGEDGPAILQELELPEVVRRRRRQEQQQRQAHGNNEDNNNGQGGENVNLNNNNNNNNEDPNAFAWEQTFFLGGRIDRPADNNANPAAPPPPMMITSMIYNLLADILYLVGSFVLSIFPMWRPQAIPLQQGEAAAAGDNDDYPNPNNNNEPQQQQQAPGDNGPGQVRPPRDPAANDGDDE